MKRHALFFATALAVASLGAAGLAAAQSAPVDGKGHPGHRGAHAMHGGHAMHVGIERMDSDGDGRISRAEFDVAKTAREEARAARMAERAKAGAGESPRREGARMAVDFDAIDADKDGYIVRSEAAAHRERMRAQMQTRRAERFAEAFAAADLNRDGKLSRVEVDEKMPRLSKRFAWMDDNRDGFLDRGELQAGKRR